MKNTLLILLFLLSSALLFADLPYIENLSPDSLSVDVAVNTNIEFDLHDLDGILIDSILVTITENANEDMTNYSLFHSNLGVNQITDNFYEIQIDPNVNFRYGDSIFVNVRALDILENELNVTYWFKCVEDNSSPFVQNLEPSNGESGVSVNSQIHFDVKDSGGAGVNLSTVEVNVNGSIYNYLDVGIFSSSSIDYGYEIIIDSPEDFNFGATINLEITAEDLAIPANTLIEISSFECDMTNTSPTVENFSIQTNEDVAIVVPFSQYSSDDQGIENLTYHISDYPEDGIYSNGSYIPDTNFNGTDELTYRAFDGETYSNVATVTINIAPRNDEPVADAGESQFANELILVTLDASSSFDPDGDEITYLWSAPAGITLSDETAIDPTFIAPEVVGSEELNFVLIVSDAEYNDISSVSVTILNVNQPPIADAGEDQIVNEEDLVTLNASNSYDQDLDNLYYTWTAPEEITLFAPSSSEPNFIAPLVTENTEFTFTLIVNDGEYDSEVDAVVITVLNIVNHEPEINLPQMFTFNEDEELTLNFISYIEDEDGDDLTLDVFGNENINIQIDEDNSVTFTNYNQDWNGMEENIIFSVSDGEFLIEQEISVTVIPINDPPILNITEDFEFDEEGSLTTNFATFITQTYGESEELILSATNSSHIDVQITLYYDDITFESSIENWFGTENITFSLSDGEFTVNQTIPITVNPVNDMSIASDITVETNEDIPVEIILTGSDADGDDLTFEVIDAPINGTYESNIYTPTENYFGTDSFTYRAFDGELYSEIATVSITIILIPEEIIPKNKVKIDPHTVDWNNECKIYIFTHSNEIIDECKILNRRGKLIYSFKNNEINSTIFEDYNNVINWDKTDQNGRQVPGGFYIYQVKIDDKIYQGSIIIVR